MAEKYSRVCMYHIFFNHPSVDGHLGYSHVLAVQIARQQRALFALLKGTSFILKWFLNLISWSS